MSEHAHAMMSENSIEGGISSSRKSQRRSVEGRSVARDDTGRPYHVEVTDFSREGCCFVSGQPIAVGGRVRIGLSGAGAHDGDVIWRDGTRHGCHFSKPLSDADMARAFTGPTVAYIGATRAPVAEPAGIGRYSRRTRTLIFVGGAVAGWATVIAAIMATR